MMASDCVAPLFMGGTAAGAASGKVCAKNIAPIASKLVPHQNSGNASK